MKGLLATGVFVALLLLIGAGAASARGMWNGNGAWAQGAYHQQMEEIIEEGTYDDLVALREETGRRMMPWVDDEESFRLAQERHAYMEARYGEDARAGCMGWRAPQ